MLAEEPLVFPPVKKAAGCPDGVGQLLVQNGIRAAGHGKGTAKEILLAKVAAF